MWGLTFDDYDPPDDEALAVVRELLPNGPPLGAELVVGEYLRFIEYDPAGRALEVVEFAWPPSALMRKRGLPLAQYAAFLRAAFRAYPSCRVRAFAPGVLEFAASLDEETMERILLDDEHRARILHPLLAARLAERQGLPVPEGAVAALVGAYVDHDESWARAQRLIAQALACGDRSVGRYLLPAVQAQVNELLQGGIRISNDQEEDLDLKSARAALPLIELAGGDTGPLREQLAGYERYR
jgi:hypothetical protein